MQENFLNLDIEADESVTEPTEKMLTSYGGGKFEIVLDVIIVNTGLRIETLNGDIG